MSTPYTVTTTFWDHATAWTDCEDDAGHSTDGGRVFGITRTRYVECDHYGCLPVAVVSYEEREHVEMLAAAYANLTPASPNWSDRDPAARRKVVDDLSAALRHFADPKPPKPDEPTGLGAVVEDSEGRIFIRYGASLAPWIGAASNPDHDPDRPYRYWSGIDAVRKLSEGVTQ